jgi:hypothetical protein
MLAVVVAVDTPTYLAVVVVVVAAAQVRKLVQAAMALLIPEVEVAACITRAQLRQVPVVPV